MYISTFFKTSGAAKYASIGDRSMGALRRLSPLYASFSTEGGSINCVKIPNDLMGRAGMGSWVGAHGGKTGRVHVDKE